MSKEKPSREGEESLMEQATRLGQSITGMLRERAAHANQRMQSKVEQLIGKEEVSCTHICQCLTLHDPCGRPDLVSQRPAPLMLVYAHAACRSWKKQRRPLLETTTVWA